MKKFIVLAIPLFSFVPLFYNSSAQTRPAPVKINETKSAPMVAELSEAEWKTLTDALQAENWNRSAALAAEYLQKLKTDNEKKQLAQLRYFYLYSLAGKSSPPLPPKVPTDDSMWKELDAAVSNFVGKEFILPPRRALPECRQVLNYICAVKDNDRAVRVTATNEAGTMIHSFDYVAFDEKISLAEFTGKEIFLGGRLKRAEFNQDTSKLWAMRLFFEKGFASVAANEK